MRTLIKMELHRTRKILGVWLGIMLLLCAFCYFEFLSLQDSMEEMAQMIDQLPRILAIMFGVKAALDTSLGWYSCLYFWTGILAFSYAVYLGISCVAKENKQGTAAFLFTKPVSRKQIVWAKAVAALGNLFVFAVFTGVCNYFMIILPAGGLEQKGAVVTTTMGMFLTQAVLFAAALFLAAMLQSYRTAVRAGGIFLIAAYALAMTAEYTGIGFLDCLTPLRYFDVYEVSLHGFEFFSLLLSAGILVLCVWGAGKQWEKREL